MTWDVTSFGYGLCIGISLVGTFFLVFQERWRIRYNQLVAKHHELLDKHNELQSRFERVSSREESE